MIAAPAIQCRRRVRACGVRARLAGAPTFNCRCAAYLTILAIAILSLSRDGTASEAERDALLDEVVAGIEGNLALLQHGVAKYAITNTKYFESQGLNEKPDFDGVARGPYTYEQIVYFDYPRLRVDQLGRAAPASAEPGAEAYRMRLILDGEHRIQYDPPPMRMPDGSALPAKVNFAFIYAQSEDDLANANHPRRQIDDLPPPQLAMRWVRNYKNVSLIATREPEDLIHVSIESQERKHRSDYWFSSTQGYTLVRLEARSLKVSDGLVRAYRGEPRRVGTGGFVLGRRSRVERVFVDGAYRPDWEEEVELLEIDLDMIPDERIFNLAGLNLPVGATVNDNIAGKRYKYGVPDVDEKKIAIRALSGPSTAHVWTLSVYLALGIALIVTGYFWQRRRVLRKSRNA